MPIVYGIDIKNIQKSIVDGSLYHAITNAEEALERLGKIKTLTDTLLSRNANDDGVYETSESVISNLQTEMAEKNTIIESLKRKMIELERDIEIKNLRLQVLEGKKERKKNVVHKSGTTKKKMAQTSQENG